MTMTTAHAAATVLAGLSAPAGPQLDGRRAAFLGCGDSLAAARPAELLGHRVISAGDTAWSGEAPRGVDVVVPLSWSGRTGATIRAAEIAKAAGQRVISITTNEQSPLAEISDDVIVVPAFDLTEDIPAIGYAVHSAAVAQLCTGTPLPLDRIAEDWAAATSSVTELVTRSGQMPWGVAIASMPDAHGAAEFWMLKLIEATGLTVRTTAIEEVGHVDYFTGPQPHLALMLAGDADVERATALGHALARNGQHVVQVRLSHLTRLTGWARQVLGGVVGADVAAGVADAWDRPYFRGGQVDMSAQHIQVPTA